MCCLAAETPKLVATHLVEPNERTTMEINRQVLLCFNPRKNGFIWMFCDPSG